MEIQTHDTQDMEKTQHKTWYKDVNHKQETKNQTQEQTETGVLTSPVVQDTMYLPVTWGTRVCVLFVIG